MKIFLRMIAERALDLRLVQVGHTSFQLGVERNLPTALV